MKTVDAALSYRLAVPFFAALATTGASAPADTSRLPVVIVQRADYPPDVVAAKTAGDVQILLRIEPDGRLRCTLAGQPAPAVLRRPSCQLVASRWPYLPNIDRRGVPQETEVPLLVRWSPPDHPADTNSGFGGATPISPDRWLVSSDYPLIATLMGNTATVRIAFDVTPEGGIANCTVERAKGTRDLTGMVCPLIQKRALLLPAVGPDGMARTAKGTINVTFRLP